MGRFRRVPVWVRYLAVVAWMVVIFRASATADLKAVPIAQRWGLLPDLLGPTVTHILELVLRKSAHLLSFGLLALLGAWATGRRGTGLIIAVFYAMTDEYHQTFVPGREGRLLDVGIDSVGALLALWVAGMGRQSKQHDSGTVD